MNLLKSFIWKGLFIALLIYGVRFEAEWAGNLLVAWVILCAVAIPLTVSDEATVRRCYELPTWRKHLNNTVNVWACLMLVMYGWWVTAILMASVSLCFAAMQSTEVADDHRG